MSKFEIGKKYKPKGFIGVIVTCVYIHSNGQAVGEWDHGRIGVLDETWEEYIPPVKKEGWIAVYKSLAASPERRAKGYVYSTKEDCIANHKSPRFVTALKIEWEE